MSSGKDTLGIRYVDSDESSHFTGALVENAIELESIDFPSDWKTIGLGECIIESATVQSKQNLDWDLWIFSSSSGNSATLGDDGFIDGFSFPKTSGLRIAGANQYYYSSPSNHLAVPYYDEDRSSTIHIALINRSAVAKFTGATGEVKVRLMVRPIYGI